MMNEDVSRRNFVKTCGVAAIGAMTTNRLDAQENSSVDIENNDSLNTQSASGVITQTYRFRNGSAGMLPCFTDYSLHTTGFDFRAEVRPLPAEVDVEGNRNAFYIQGNNRSDDLFMFLKAVLGTKQGIKPNRSYLLSFNIALASRSNNCFGIGGGEDSVWLKAGGSTVEPVPVLEPSGYISINIDKGDQSQGGKNLGVVGSIFNGEECPISKWVLLRRSYDHPHPIRSSSGGELWIATGVESGFEGLTGVYFYYVVVTLTPIRDS